jgi:hypothetical protein
MRVRSSVGQFIMISVPSCYDKESRKNPVNKRSTMTEPRHDTREMSTDEILKAIDRMDPDSVAPPSMVSEVILAAQFPDGVTCPDCGHFFVPAPKLANDEITMDSQTEAPTNKVKAKTREKKSGER